MSLAIDDIFNRVTFDGDDRQYHYDLYVKVKALAEEIDRNAPDCDEKTLAFRSLHLALMHVGSAFGKKDKYK
jgi:hypothetical protein